MTIDFICHGCQHTLRVPAESAGKKARCPQCGMVQAIPQEESRPAEPRAGASGFNVDQFDQPSGPPVRSPSQSPSNYPNPSASQREKETPYESFPAQAGTYRPAPYQGSHPQTRPYAARPKTREEVAGRIKPPAIAMLVLSILAILGLIVMVIMVTLDMANGGNTEDAVGGFIVTGVIFVMQSIILIGSVRMMMLKNYPLAVATAILTLVSGLCCQLLMPFGIWALIILLDSDTKQHFS